MARRFAPLLALLAACGGGDDTGAQSPTDAASTDSGGGVDSGAPGADSGVESGAGADASDEGPPPDASDAGVPGKTPLLFGVVEEQLAICYATYPCSDITDDDTRRAAIAQLAPGMTVRWGGYETERTGLGYSGEAARRAFENVATGGDQLEPSWLISRAKEAAYAAWILAVPVTWSVPQAFGGNAHAWDATDATTNMDVWKTAVDQAGFPPPAYIELGNEPWLHGPEGTPDGFTTAPADYVQKARPIGTAIASKIAAFGWPTRVAVVVDNWSGTHFETAGDAVMFPAETIQLARDVAALLPGSPAPVVQTHAYPLHGGYWCPLPATTGSADIACVYALYTMLRQIAKAAPGADIVLTEDNYDSNVYPRSGVYTTLASLLTFAAGGVAYTHFGNNNYSHTGDRYELFNGLQPVPLLQNDIARVAALVKGLNAGDVSLQSATGSVPIPAGGYAQLVNAKTAPDAAYASGTAPTRYVLQVGAKTVTVDIDALSVTVGP
jgi:hypothetical protein